MNKLSPSARWLLLAASLAAIAGCFRLLGSHPAEGASVIRYALRLGIVGFGLVAWFVSQSLISSRGPKTGAIADKIHELTAPLHAYLEAHPRCANATLIASSALIDLLGIFLIGAGVFGPSMRPFAALILLFAMRQACQALCALPAPPGMIWRHPGFPSLLVTYDVANDFFFSGHTAIAALAAVEAAQVLPGWLAAAVAAIAVMEASVVLVLRAHYTMDVFAAIVAACCAAGLGNWLSAGW
jgi:hypothetical protein